MDNNNNNNSSNGTSSEGPSGEPVRAESQSMNRLNNNDNMTDNQDNGSVDAHTPNNSNLEAVQSRPSDGTEEVPEISTRMSDSSQANHDGNELERNLDESEDDDYEDEDYDEEEDDEDLYYANYNSDEIDGDDEDDVDGDYEIFEGGSDSAMETMVQHMFGEAMGVVMYMEAQAEFQRQQEEEERKRVVKCPVCSEIYRDYKESDHPNRLAAYKNPSHACSHGATMLFVKIESCPICMEDDLHQPVVALACGHVICRDDFVKLGGIVGPRSQDHQEPLSLPDLKSEDSGQANDRANNDGTNNDGNENSIPESRSRQSNSGNATSNRARERDMPGQGGPHLSPAMMRALMDRFGISVPDGFEGSSGFFSASGPSPGFFFGGSFGPPGFVPPGFGRQDSHNDEDTDGDMPPLVSRQNDGDSDNSSDTDDDMPPLEPRRGSRSGDNDDGDPDEGVPPLEPRNDRDDDTGDSDDDNSVPQLVQRPRSMANSDSDSDDSDDIPQLLPANGGSRNNRSTGDGAQAMETDSTEAGASRGNRGNGSSRRNNSSGGDRRRMASGPRILAAGFGLSMLNQMQRNFAMSSRDQNEDDSDDEDFSNLECVD